MSIETILLQLADLVSKIENARALLTQPEATSLTKDDRGHVEAMLVRLTAKKVDLEDQLRAMLEKRGR